MAFTWKPSGGPFPARQRSIAHAGVTQGVGSRRGGARDPLAAVRCGSVVPAGLALILAGVTARSAARHPDK